MEENTALHLEIEQLRNDINKVKLTHSEELILQKSQAELVEKENQVKINNLGVLIEEGKRREEEQTNQINQLGDKLGKKKLEILALNERINDISTDDVIMPVYIYILCIYIRCN